MTKKRIVTTLTGITTFSGVMFSLMLTTPTIHKEASVLTVNENIELENISIDFKDDKAESDGDVIAEKIAINPIYIFNEVDVTAFISNENATLKKEPIDESEDMISLNIYDEIKVIGINEFNYSKVLYNNEIYYIPNSNYSEDIRNIYTNTEKENNYVLNNNVELKTTPFDDGETALVLNKFDELEVVGKNPHNSNYVKVNYNNETYYVNTTNLTNDKGSIFKDVDITLYANTTVKLRTTPGGDDYYEKLNTNDKAHIIGENDNYYMVNYNGNTGYILKKYLSSEKVTVGGTDVKSGDKVVAQFTAYCSTDPGCTDYDAMGNYLNPANNTCAAPACIPFGTKIQIVGTGTYLDGQIFTVTDRGGAIKVKSDGTYIFDILMSNTNECIQFGRQNGYAIIIK